MKRGLFRVSLLMMSIVLVSIIVSACSKEKSFENGDGSGGLRSKEYPLNEVNGSGVDGSIVITENADSTFNVLVNLNKSEQDTGYVLHMHHGSISNPGAIAILLTAVTGTGGAVQSETTNIREVRLPDNTRERVTYDDILSFEGYVDVHAGTQTDPVIAQGTIGN
jgi:hypothetical protein